MKQEPYRTFESVQSRRELYQYCKRVTDYLHKHRIPSLILPDRSARPLATGVRECWMNTYADQKLPHIYFINPYGFKTSKDLTDTDLFKQAFPGITGENTPPLPDPNKTRERIQEEFTQHYPQLIHDKNKPVLIFDSCIHSGGTLSSVKDTLRRLGFSDVRIGTVQDAPMNSSVSPDLYIKEDNDVPVGKCHPFGFENLVKKTYDKVHSERNPDPAALKRAQNLREEIKRIVQEKGQK